ncbi:hypothetical protein JCM3765_001591 [Sporobolomyces pararoseus]
MSRTKEDSKINYAEVDSDVDLDEEERELEQNNNINNKGKKKVGDTFGTGSNSKKKKRKSAARRTERSEDVEDEPEEPTYDSKLLLALPFDLFAEVCSHLKGRDLLKLAQVNKAIRKILLSRSSRSIWSALRRRLGFALPSGMEELGFALLEYSDKCQFCGDPRMLSRWVFLRVRSCYSCSKVYTISSKGLKNAWPDLHPQANSCVRYLDVIYLVDDLQAVDEQLKELEEEDEIAVSLLQSLKSKRSSTRSRPSGTTVEEVEANNVDNFVKERQEWVKLEQQTSHDIISSRERLRKIEAEAARVERLARQALQDSILDSLKEVHGWEDDEVGYFRNRLWLFEELAPKASIEEDPEAWNQCRTTIRDKLDNDAARRREWRAQNDRRALLRPYYDSLSDLHSRRYDVFPSFRQFLGSSSIRPLWEPEDAAPLTDETWKKSKPMVFRVLNDWEEKNRIEAIRFILAANQGLASTSSLSSNSQDYPKSTYDDDFFCRLSSLFVLVESTPQGRSIAVAAYQRTVQEGNYKGPSSLKERISVRHVHIIRSICKAINLDADEAFIPEIDRFGDNFVWTNDPRKTLRNIKRGWLDLLEEALRYGPTNRKIINGEQVEVEYRPDDESVNDSQAFDIEDEFDDDAREGGGDDEEEEESEEE